MSMNHSVTMIGSGNLAWHLAPALDNVQFPVRQVYSRHRSHAEALVGRLYSADVHDTLDFSTSDSTLFILAVSDDVIGAIAREIVLPDQAILLHTSGSKPLELLDYAATERTGVFYPLQTFTKGHKTSFEEIPIFVESGNSDVLSILKAMGSALSKKVVVASSQQRMALHIAAVFASNFTNHMLTLSKQVMEENKLTYEWLHPLIIETINKSLAVGPEVAQTGPARRRDLETLDLHFDFLDADPETRELYREISQHILDHYE